ncbi:Uncharacterised protein [Vibrio cholerae]|nr:Uncharacterised protein [Vibrio cholerae]
MRRQDDGLQLEDRAVWHDSDCPDWTESYL